MPTESATTFPIEWCRQQFPALARQLDGQDAVYLDGPAGSQTIYGLFGDASVIGWTGNSEGVTACLGGSVFVTTANGPGSGSTAAVTGTSYGYGVYNDTATTWQNADGYLPALVTTFTAAAPASR